jgi:hypothetical protein
LLCKTGKLYAFTVPDALGIGPYSALPEVSEKQRSGTGEQLNNQAEQAHLVGS